MEVFRPLRMDLLPSALPFVVGRVGEAYPTLPAMQGPTAASATTYVPTAFAQLMLWFLLTDVTVASKKSRTAIMHDYRGI
jgi:hypothetical protein